MPSHPTILIVDDSEVNLNFLQRILAAEGYRTVVATNGPDARKLAESEKPDLILLDVMMPGESGFDTCIRLKQSSKTSNIPIIFVSAIDDISSKVKGLSIGGVDYITKPFARAEVLARIGLHLNLKLAYQAFIETQALKLKQLKDAQQAILIQPEELPEAQFGVGYIPVNEAGGDFYDVIKISHNIFGYFVADISGHDLGASYMTSALKALINQNARPGHTPEETMKDINSVLTSMMKEGQHLTGCYAYLNRIRSKLTVISAGHPPVIFIDEKGNARILESSGDILGAFPTVAFEPVDLRVEPGSRFFMYTDGLIEASKEAKRSREKGLESLLKICVSTRNLPIERAAAEIINCFLQPGHIHEDDLVVLGVEC